MSGKSEAAASAGKSRRPGNPPDSSEGLLISSPIRARSLDEEVNRMEIRSAIEAADESDRPLVLLPFSMWMDNECDAELERSIWRESERMADEEAERWRNSDDDDDVLLEQDVVLEQEDIRGILSQLCDFGAIKAAASPDYVDIVNRVMSGKLKFGPDLRFVGHDGFDIVASISRSAAAKLHAFSEANGHRLLLDDFDLDGLRASKVEDWSDEFSVLLGTLLESEDVQSRIFDHLASSTDALCCDRLLDLKEYEIRAHRLRRERRDKNKRIFAEAKRKREQH
jgi:hypothetical protein